ncbi:MAG: hypothetical protein MZV70_49200 [Desulfobacterales bacterium]|nr:hypothetical protein [Desulfobacterales bacterium]
MTLRLQRRGGRPAPCRWRCCWPSWPTGRCGARPFYKTLIIWPYAVAPGRGRRAVVLPVQPHGRHGGLLPEAGRRRLEPHPQRRRRP